MLVALVGAAILALVITGIALRPRKVRFAFAEHEDYIALVVQHRLWSDDFGLVTMSYLREAARLKLVSDYRRLLVNLRHVTVTDDASFWLLIGGLGPLFLSETMRTAIVCGPKTRIGKRLRESGLAEAFASEAEALAFLRSDEPARPIMLDREWVESLLVARNRPTAPPLKRAA